MISAPLITDDRYYFFRRNILLFSFVPIFPFVLLLNSFETNWIVFALAILIYAFIVFYASKSQKLMNAFVNQETIEMNEGSIVIKTKKGEKKENLDLTQVESIILQNRYILPQDSAKDIAHEIIGKQAKNHVIFVLNKKEYKYDFLLDSFYKIEQLNKLIANWQQSGYPITYQS